MTVAARKPAGAGSGTAAFLARHGLAGVTPGRLRRDASARRHYRLPGTGSLLMRAPADPQSFLSSIRVARHLNKLGLSAPRVQCADPALGMALIEDRGEATCARQLADGRSESDLCALAVDAPVRLHKAPPGTAIAQPRYDFAVLLTELTAFCDWFAPAIAPELDVTGFRRQFLALWEAELRDLADRRDTLVLRDFPIDNLTELEGSDGKPGYPKWLQRILGQLERALPAAGLGTITEFLSAELSDWRHRGETLAQALSREFAARPEGAQNA